ncbi:TfoX/Sxy family protein [Mesorhizobium sp. CU2]|uniref:TfoX/Sxy family protein n=1 Tax=unclassified Mesorhizobium TaxID=325217 RepID=UPI0011264B80|nr:MULTISPECIES: TfoX/Sxy family protein [unclassified Mesorhizobium]TPN79561.1 TfoX/Sxy family protein [Mesorhizobium sp. CU3]TPO20034.1 TfoX/Sxy family protein [Mesorhizobium sp. CU2]
MAKSVSKTSVAIDPMVGRLRAALGSRAFTEQKMFGGTCFMLNGNMLIGTSKRGLLVRVGKAAHATAAGGPHASPMEMGGRSMEGYVRVAPEGVANEADLAAWLDRALAFVETLPPKVKPAKARRA